MAQLKLEEIYLNVSSYTLINSAWRLLCLNFFSLESLHILWLLLRDVIF